MAASLLSEVLLCAGCGSPLRLGIARMRACCCQSNGHRLDRSILRYDPDLAHREKPEMRARDRQAHGYMLHAKLPTQIHRIRSFVAGLPAEARALPVLDLGCGPGPTTAILLAAGFSVIAVDFSLTSLGLNEEQCRNLGDVLYVHADLTQVRFAEQCVGGLMMADFLQHLGGADTQRAFLRRAFAALRPGGWFFLSFFNINLKNRFKGDIEGAYANGEIPYRRLTTREVVAMLPAYVEITAVLPMNIFHSAAPDRLVARLPYARHFARMMVICGHKGRG